MTTGKKRSATTASKKKWKKKEDEDDDYSDDDDDDDDDEYGDDNDNNDVTMTTRPSRATSKKKRMADDVDDVVEEACCETMSTTNGNNVMSKGDRRHRRLTIVLLITRSSPNTSDTNCSFQKRFCASALKYLKYCASYFPDGYKLILIPQAIGQSAYSIAGSEMLLNVIMRLKEYNNHKVVIVFSDVLRIGRDARNIGILMEMVQRHHTNVELIPLSTIGMSIEQGRDMIEKLRKNRRKVYKNNKKAVEEVSVSDQEKEIQKRIKKVVGTLTEHYLGPHREYVSDLLNQDEVIIGLDDEQSYLYEVESIISECGTAPADKIHQSLLELGDELCVRKSSDITRKNVHYYRSSRRTADERIHNNVIITPEGLPYDQWTNVVATMKVLKHKSNPGLILYDRNISKTTIGMGIVKLIALIVADQVGVIIIKEHSRFPTKLVPIIIALCKLRNTEIVVAENYGKDLNVLAKAEQIRQDGNRKTMTDYKEALEACKKDWDKKTLLVHNFICEMKTSMLGESSLGNTNQKGKGKKQKARGL